MRKNVYVNDKLGKRADLYSDELNFSEIFRNALKREILLLEAQKASESERLKEDDQERGYFWNKNGKGFGDVWLDQYLENFVVKNRVNNIEKLSKSKDKDWFDRLPEWGKRQLENIEKTSEGNILEDVWARGFIRRVRERNEELWDKYTKEMI